MLPDAGCWIYLSSECRCQTVATTKNGIRERYQLRHPSNFWWQRRQLLADRENEIGQF
jgi:hypothetical protein